MERNTKGITLISLAVTILIILILAGITIGVLFGDNGIIKKAQEAGDQTEIAVVREKLELAKGTEYIESNGKYNPDSYFQIIEDEGIINDKETDVVDNGDGTYEVTTPEGYIFEITLVPSKDNVENIEIEYIGKADGPRIRDINITNKTTNSVTVEVNATNVKDATYSYYYKKNGDADWTKVGEGKETTYTFNGLETNVAYDIKVVVEEDGKSIEKEIKVTTGSLPVETVKFSDVTWNNGEASITISTSETGYTMQYQKGGTEENNWTTITSGTTIENLKHGDIIYVRLYDGTNGSEAVSVTVKDEIEPTVAVTKGAITTNSITVNASSSDTQYGMPASPTYNYYIKKSSETDYPTTASHTGTETSYTFSGLSQNTSYDVKVTVADKAGNIGTGTLLNTATGQIAGADEGLENGSITATTPTWSNGSASLTLSTTTGLTIQYQKNGIDGTWTTGTSVTGLAHGDTVYVRLTDGTNYGDYGSISIQDKEAPTVTVTKGAVATNSIAVSVSSSDAQYGMPTSPTYNYYIKKSSETDYPTTANHTGTETSYTFSGLTQNTSYDVKVTTADKAGNIGTGTLLNTTTGQIAGADEGLKDGSITATTPTWSDGTASITLSTTTGLTIQYQVNGITEGSWKTGTSVTGLAHGDTVYVRLTDGTNYGDYGSISIQDKEAPTVTVTKGAITTNSITVNASSSDAQYGMPASPTYNYYIKKSSEADYPTTASHTGTETSYTFSGLTQNTSYDVKVTVADKAGNVGTGTLLNTATGQIAGADEGLKDGSITATTPTWSNGSASLTLSTTTGLTIQYQVNGITEGSWKTGTSVTGLKHNDTVYARLTDGTNYGDYANVTILDSTVPQAATISLSRTSATPAKGITATVTLKDNESGVNVTSSKYIYSTTSGNIGTTSTTWNSASSFSSNGQTITLKSTTVGTYYLHVLTVDNAGNKTETVSSGVTVEDQYDMNMPYNGSYYEKKGVNTPKLGTGMTAIKWNGSTWEETKGNDVDWYDYSNKEWANAKTSDGSMWVWIPRYAYRITSGYHSNTAGTIEVEFMKGTTNTSSSGRTSFSNASGLNNWLIHPAFSYNGTVSGIWVAKFEASRSDASSSEGSSSTMKIQPGVRSWCSYRTINDIYTNCLNYNSTLKSHMMKNSEWGAVAYLTQSKYGKNEEVWINNSGNYITGSAGNSASAEVNEGTTNDYTSTQGQEASTTGNVTGIYDMRGGAEEYVAAYVDNGDSELTSNGSSLVNGASYTKDVYSTGSSDTATNNYAANASVYGDAVYETSRNVRDNYSWYAKYNNFPYAARPFFGRGGNYSGGADYGMFSFVGKGNSGNYSFRPVLVAN